MGKYNSRKRKTKKNIPAGEVHIHSTFNNTIVTITDLEGNVVSWASAGTQGIKGSKKSTPYAAGMAAEAAGKGHLHRFCRRLCQLLCGLLLCPARYHLVSHP